VRRKHRFWAVFFAAAVLCTGCLSPPADFTFVNGAEPQTLDPAIATGVPENRLIRGLFEGLTTRNPYTLENIPGMAESWEVLEGGTVYIFHIRRDAKWSNGEPLTAHDFYYSWKRVLEPATAAQYAYQLYYLKNAEAYNAGTLTDFSRVGLQVLDDYTLKVDLANPTPYFLDLTSFYTLFPAHRASVERWGDFWVKPEYIVCNGPYMLKDWHVRHEIYMVKNPHYWDAANVKLESLRALPNEDSNTGLNMYLHGTAEWIESGAMPTQLMDKLLERPDMHSAPYLGIYFARVNVTKPPLSDPRVRRAFAMSFRREDVVKYVSKAGEVPAYTYVPPIPNYESPKGYEYNVEEARRLLAEAGYPGGKGFPKIRYLYNTLEAHRDIAEVLQAQWKENLGVEIELVNQEWKVYLNSQRQIEYDFSRSGWIGDYVDPDTFLNMWVTGGGNNNTGWSDKEYDSLIAQASRTGDPSERMAVLKRAEEILIERGPTLPIYFYVVKWMYPPYVGGAPPNVLGELFLKNVTIDWKMKRKTGDRKS
jgi:oligopeptide transport system substrate-binding protein